VDVALAREQWLKLKSTYEKIGFEVLVVKGDHSLPDMVFAANQSFPFLNGRKQNSKTVVLSRMRSEFRRPEVPYFKTFYTNLGYQVEELQAPSKEIFFEGNGDALPHYPFNLVWGGYGERTSPDVYHELSERFGLQIAMLKLVNKNFYHLDTCFSILDEQTVVIQPEAFEAEGLKLIKAIFKNVIESDLDENLKFFVCNCHSPDGRHVIVNKGAKKFVADARRLNFEVIELDTSEFLKSGGSVFCMKMMVY
jgi:N-dimethylarginine dimethylaminohydrolase